MKTDLIVKSFSCMGESCMGELALPSGEMRSSAVRGKFQDVWV
jgi:hypothetical protein